MPPEDGLQLLNRYVNITPEVFSRLTLYHALLIKWQVKINLIANDSLQDVWKRHFLDSLQLLPLMPSGGKPVIDMGSGAGFPGMALAIAGIPNVHLIESDAKKIVFLKEVARITSTDIFIHHSRIEDCKIPDAAVIIARALAPLPELLTYASGNVSRETICFFPKGKNYAKEISDAQKGRVFDHALIQSVSDNEGVILRISNLRRR